MYLHKGLIQYTASNYSLQRSHTALLFVLYILTIHFPHFDRTDKPWPAKTCAAFKFKHSHETFVKKK